MIKHSTFALRKIGILLLSAFLISIMSTGCGNYYKKQFEKSGYDYGSDNARSKEGIQTNDAKMYGLKVDGKKNHANTSLTFSQELSDDISSIPGLATALVFLTDRNAYAAIVLNQTATGSKTDGKLNDDVDNTGTSRGMYNTFTGSQYMDPNKLVDRTNSYYTVSHHEKISSALKQKVAKAIRHNHPKVIEVHISANRDFVNQMNVYAQEYRMGVPLNKYTKDFNKLAVHYFGVKP